MKDKEQLLVDVCFGLALTLHKYPDDFKNKTDTEIAEWVSDQLRTCCGIETTPCGASWGVIKK